MPIHVSEPIHPVPEYARAKMLWPTLVRKLSPKWYIAILAVIVLAGAGLRFHGLGHESFWYNEAASYYYARGTAADVIRHSYTDETNPPGFYLLIHFWMRMVGISESALRLPSALAGSLTLLVMALFARQFLSRVGSLIASALLACWPLHVWYSQECRGFAFWVLSILSAYLCLFAWLRSGQGKYLFLNSLLIVMAVSFHYFGFHAVLVENAFLLLARPTTVRQRWKQWLLSQAVLALALAPFAVMMLMVDRTNVAWWREAGVTGQALKSLFFHLGGVYFFLSGERLLKVALLAANGALLIMGILRLRPGSRTLFLLLAVILPVLLNLGYSVLVSPILGNSQSVGRYFLLILPPYLILIAAGWEGLWLRLRTAPSALMFVALLGLCLAGIRAGHRNLIFTRDDNRRLCAELLDRARPSDLVIAAPYITLDYYAHRLGRDMSRLHVLKTWRFDKTLAERLPARADRIWCYADPLHHFTPLLEELQRRYGLGITRQVTEQRLSSAGLVLLEAPHSDR